MNQIKNAIGTLALAGWATAAGASELPKVSFSGYVETYYQYLSEVNSGTNFAGLVPNRAFDQFKNQFAPASGELMLTGSQDESGIGFNLDLGFGEKNVIIWGSSDPYQFTSLFQANLSKTLHGFKFTFGKQATFIGTEVWNTANNSNFSRGLLYAKEPLLHNGLRVDYSLGSFNLMALVDNGANGGSYTDSVGSLAPYGDQGLGASLAYAGSKTWGLTLSWYKQPTVYGGELTATQYGNALANYKISDGLNLNAEYLYVLALVNPGTSLPYNVTHGYALYANYATPLSGLSLNGRWEQVNQPDLGVLNNSYTATLKYADGALTHTLEYRADANNRPSGVPDQSTVSLAQGTLTYAANYAF